MSRIVLSRHSDGSERMTAGWDRPAWSGFVDVYDADGECVETHGPLSGESLSPLQTVAVADAVGELDRESRRRLLDLLEEHRASRSASDATLDLAGGAS